MLKNNDNVFLKYTEKTDQKIRRNQGQEFYEKGRWGTLDQFQEEFDEAFLQALTIYREKPEKLELLAIFLEAHWKTLRLLIKLESQLHEELELAPQPKLLEKAFKISDHGFFSERNFLSEVSKLNFSFSKHLPQRSPQIIK